MLGFFPLWLIICFIFYSLYLFLIRVFYSYILQRLLPNWYRTWYCVDKPKPSNILELFLKIWFNVFLLNFFSILYFFFFSAKWIWGLINFEINWIWLFFICKLILLIWNYFPNFFCPNRNKKLWEITNKNFLLIN